MTVYRPPDAGGDLPVIYVADGQSVGLLAAFLEPLICASEVPPVLLVGIHSGPFRSDEYTTIPASGLTGEPENPRFAAHEQFVVDEVLLWAEQTLGASSQREKRAAFGFSNGGVWAVFQGIRHPSVFGSVLSFSCGACAVALPDEPVPAVETSPRYYFLAGHLEPSFLRSTRAAADALRDAGHQVVMRERVAGHDLLMWSEQFGDAVRWAFGTSPTVIR